MQYYSIFMTSHDLPKNHIDVILRQVVRVLYVGVTMTHFPALKILWSPVLAASVHAAHQRKAGCTKMLRASTATPGRKIDTTT